MFSHTSPPNPAPGPTSVRKHWFVCFFLFFSLVLFVFLWFLLVFQWFWVFFDCFYWFFNGFLWFYTGFEQFLMVFIGFPYGFALFWVVPFGFSLFFYGFCIGFERKAKGKLLENQSQPTPGPLRSFLLSLSLLWPPGLLWLALSPSFLSLSPVTRNKEEIRLWGLSGASVWDLPPLSFWSP